MESCGKCDSWWSLNIAAGKFGWVWRTRWSSHQERRDKITQSIFPKHFFGWEFKITSSGLMFNYWLSIMKGSFSGVSAFSGETHTWKIMQNLTSKILASLPSSRFDMKCPARGRWVHHGNNLSLPLQLIHTLAQVSGEWFPKFPFLSHRDFLTSAEHMELNPCSLNILHPSSTTSALTQTPQALPL